MKYYIDTEFLEGTQKEKFPINLFRKNTPNTIDLISIGIVAEDGREYYAISKDFNLKEAWNRYDEKVNMNYKPSFGGHHDGHYNPKFIKEYWIRDNVLKPIFDEWIKRDKHWTNKDITLGNWDFNYKNFKYFLNKYGKTNKQIAEEVKEFVYSNTNHKFVNPYYFHLDTSGKLPGTLKPQFYAYYTDYDWVAFCWLFGKMIDLPKGFPMYCIDLKQELDRVEQILLNEEGKVELVSEVIPENGCAMVAEFDSIKDLPNYPKQTNEHNALADARWNKELHEFLNKL